MTSPSLKFLRLGGRRKSDAVLAFLARLTEDFSVVLDLNELLSHVTRACQEDLGFDSCSVALVDDHGGVKIAAASGLRSEYLNVTIPAGQGVHGEVVATGRPLLIPDMTADPRVFRRARGVGSGIYAPLVVQNQAIGVLSALRSEKGAFEEKDLELLILVARYVAAAVEGARLHERLKEQALNLHQQLSQALDLVGAAMLIATVEDGTILRWNRAAEHLYGYSQAEAVGRSLTMLSGHGGERPWTDVLATLRRGDPVFSSGEVHADKSGGKRLVAVTIQPMRNSAGQVRWALLAAIAPDRAARPQDAASAPARQEA